MEIFFLIQAYTSTLRMNFSLLPNFVARRSVYLHKIDVHIQFLFLTIQKRRGHQRKIFLGGSGGPIERGKAQNLFFFCRRYKTMMKQWRQGCIDYWIHMAQQWIYTLEYRHWMEMAWGQHLTG